MVRVKRWMVLRHWGEAPIWIGIARDWREAVRRAGLPLSGSASEALPDTWDYIVTDDQGEDFRFYSV